MTSLRPLYNALLIFTDGSSKGRAGYLINNQQVIIETPGLSAQLAELTAVLKVFQSVHEALNILTDSLWCTISTLIGERPVVSLTSIRRQDLYFQNCRTSFSPRKICFLLATYGLTLVFLGLWPSVMITSTEL